jgi:hypothetical protein
MNASAVRDSVTVFRMDVCEVNPYEYTYFNYIYDINILAIYSCREDADDTKEKSPTYTPLYSLVLGASNSSGALNCARSAGKHHIYPRTFIILTKIIF